MSSKTNTNEDGDHPIISKYERQFRGLFNDLASDFRSQLGGSGSGSRGFGTNLISSTFGGSSVSNNPPIDIYEAEGEWIAHVELAGIPKENVQLEVHGNELVISGEYSQHKHLSGHNIVRKERRTGKFQRSVTIPPGYKTDSIDAQYQDGILVLTIPRQADFQPQRITIK
ncbi:hypothetical protein G9A89_011100 [Geosiphon pyriformis]|nr:hypothetical protein G9A89_011100 [Geosiphon pyriformis]